MKGDLFEGEEKSGGLLREELGRKKDTHLTQ